MWLAHQQLESCTQYYYSLHPVLLEFDPSIIIVRPQYYHTLHPVLRHLTEYSWKLQNVRKQLTQYFINIKDGGAVGQVLWGLKEKFTDYR